MEQAIAWRVQAGCDPELCRLIWSEGDGLPGIIADRYRDVIVLQTLTPDGQAQAAARRNIVQAERSSTCD